MSETGSRNESDGRPRVFSIGHSNHTLDRFILLLQVNGIDTLVDVRSQPYSKIAPHFNRNSLKRALEAQGIKYEYLGQELGGKPDSDEFYDSRGHAIYGLLAKSALFLRGIRRLEEALQECRTVVMCSEEDPKECHRELLIGRVLEQQGIAMEHIRGDGHLQTEEGIQLSMSIPQEDVNWRSAKPIRSASPNIGRWTSSEP